jgi:hypothetical protein
MFYMQEKRRLSYLFLSGSFGQTRSSLDGRICRFGSDGGNLELGSARGMFKVEWIELLSNPLQNNSSLQALVSSRRVISQLPSLLLRLLRTSNSLISQ